MNPAAATSLEVRERLVEALRLDLVGPWGGHALAAERLPGWVRPSNWYLTGFVIPSGTPPEKSADADEDDDMGGKTHPPSRSCPQNPKTRRHVGTTERYVHGVPAEVKQVATDLASTLGSNLGATFSSTKRSRRA